MPPFELYRRPDGIAALVFAGGVRLTLDVAQSASDVVRSELADAPAPLLIDLRGVREVTPESRGVRPAQETGRVAILVGGFLTQLVSTEFVEHYRGGVTRSVFRDEDLAIEWLGAGSERQASPSSPSGGPSTSSATRST